MNKVKMFQDYLEKKPTDRFALYSLAYELKKAARFEEAQVAFRSLLEHHPQSGAGHYQHGELHREQGQLHAAKQAWEEGLVALQGATDAEARRSRVEIEQALDAVLDDLEDEDS